MTHTKFVTHSKIMKCLRELWKTRETLVHDSQKLKASTSELIVNSSPSLWQSQLSGCPRVMIQLEPELVVNSAPREDILGKCTSLDYIVFDSSSGETALELNGPTYRFYSFQLPYVQFVLIRGTINTGK
jgi:hypothetical protein